MDQDRITAIIVGVLFILGFAGIFSAVYVKPLAERAKKHGATDEQIAEAVACAMFVAAGSQIVMERCVRRFWAISDVKKKVTILFLKK